MMNTALHCHHPHKFSSVCHYSIAMCVSDARRWATGLDTGDATAELGPV